MKINVIIVIIIRVKVPTIVKIKINVIIEVPCSLSKEILTIKYCPVNYCVLLTLLIWICQGGLIKDNGFAGCDQTGIIVTVTSVSSVIITTVNHQC